MCNAWNHSADCPCSFGPGYGRGGGYGHGGGYYAREVVVTPAWGSERRSTVASYVNPNAHCPVCGALVYFYRSPYNGRVFFDDLGGDWPKHPCTDNRWEPRRATSSTLSPREPAWQHTGFKPLVSSRVYKTTAHRVLTGEIDGQYEVLYLAECDPVDDPSPIFVRPIEGKPNLFEISYLSSSSFQTNKRKAIGFAENIKAVDEKTLASAAQGDAEATYAIGKFLLWEMYDPIGASPYIVSAAASGVFEAQIDLAILKLLPITNVRH